MKKDENLGFFSPFAGSVCLYICERDEVEARRTEREWE